MKSLKCNFTAKFFLPIFFLAIKFCIYAETDVDVVNFDHKLLVKNFFTENQSHLYFVGTRHFFLGILFNDVFVDGDFEDRFTNLIFYLPLGGGEVGLVMQVYDRTIFDAFIFVYDQERGEFVQRDTHHLSTLLLHHRDIILGELWRVRFNLNSIELINFLLYQYGIHLR